jgi:hypothetical protein
MKKNNQKISKFLFWTPRILSILFILFLSLFSLDIFDMKLTFWETILGLLMHNIPSLVLLVILLISWKYEIVGGIAFTLAGLFYVVMLAKDNFEWYKLSWIFTIAGPAFLVGALFFVNWFQKKK